MPASEQKRFELREGLIGFIGEDRAETLMESLPPISWDELVTKEWAQVKFNEQTTVVNAQFMNVAAEFTAMRGEFAEKIGGLSKELGGLHKEIGGLHKEIGGLHVAIAESSQRMSDKLDSMRRWVVGSVVAVVGAVVGSGIWFG